MRGREVELPSGREVQSVTSGEIESATSCQDNFPRGHLAFEAPAAIFPRAIQSLRAPVLHLCGACTENSALCQALPVLLQPCPNGTLGVPLPSRLGMYLDDRVNRAVVACGETKSALKFSTTSVSMLLQGQHRGREGTSRCLCALLLLLSRTWCEGK